MILKELLNQPASYKFATRVCQSPQTDRDLVDQLALHRNRLQLGVPVIDFHQDEMRAPGVDLALGTCPAGVPLEAVLRAASVAGGVVSPGNSHPASSKPG